MTESAFLITSCPENLVAVLTDGALPLDEIKSALIAQKARQTAIEDELARLRRSSVGARQASDKIREQLAGLVADVAQLLASETDQARRVLRALLHDKIELEPQGRRRERGLSLPWSADVWPGHRRDRNTHRKHVRMWWPQTGLGSSVHLVVPIRGRAKAA